MWPAFPASDYYGRSDAPQVPLPDCWEHPFQGSLSRSGWWTLRNRLGGGYITTHAALRGIPAVGGVGQVDPPNPLIGRTVLPIWVVWRTKPKRQTPAAVPHCAERLHRVVARATRAGPTGDGGYVSRRSKPASCSSPCDSLAKPGLLAACVRLTSTFQGQLFHRGLASTRSYAPRACRLPVQATGLPAAAVPPFFHSTVMLRDARSGRSVRARRSTAGSRGPDHPPHPGRRSGDAAACRTRR